MGAERLGGRGPHGRWFRDFIRNCRVGKGNVDAVAGCPAMLGGNAWFLVPSRSAAKVRFPPLRDISG